MKTIILLFLSTFFLLGHAIAGPFVQADLTVGLTVQASGYVLHRGKLVACGRAVGKMDPWNRSPFVAQVNLGNRSIPLNSSLNYSVNADGYNYRNLTISVAQKKEKNGWKGIDVELSEKQSLHHIYEDSGDCKVQYRDYRGSNDFIDGTIRVGYQFPKDTWAIIVERTSYGGALDRQLSRGTFMVNALNESMDDGGRSKEVIWGMPGSQVYQQFNFKNYSFGGKAQGSFEIRFRPLIDPATANLSALDIYEKVRGLLKQVSDPYLVPPKGVHTNQLLKLLVALYSSPEKRAQLYNSLTTSELDRFIRQLSMVMNLRIGNQRVWNLKAAASILDFKLATRLLKQVEPFCQMKVVSLPNVQRKVSVLGIRLATYLLSRAQQKVQNYRFSEYRALLKNLELYQKQGLSFAEVRNNKAQFEKVRESYEILRNTVDMDFSPFQSALEDVKYVRDAFGSVGSNQEDTQTLLVNLTSLARTEDSFVGRFLMMLRQFQPDNSAKVEVSGLLQNLNDLTDAQDQVVNIMDHNIRFLDPKFTTGTNTFVSMMLQLITQNIDIFAKPLPQTEFDVFRQSFAKSVNFKSIEAGIEPCLVGGLK